MSNSTRLAAFTICDTKSYGLTAIPWFTFLINSAAIDCLLNKVHQ